MLKGYKYRIYPTRNQKILLDAILREHCNLYNAGLQERRDNYKNAGRTVTFFDQTAQIKDIRKDGSVELSSFSSMAHTLRRLQKSFEAFFRRIKSGETPGYPRFRSYRRYDSVVYTSGNGAKLTDSGLRILNVGTVKIKLHRPLVGVTKTVCVKRKNNKWYAIFACEYEALPLAESEEAVGIDVGIETYAVLSDGTEIANPRWYVSEQKSLRRLQRSVCRKQRRSNRRQKAVALYARCHERIANKRADFLHKLSRMVVNTYGIIAVEDLNIKGLTRSILAKQCMDASWGTFVNMLTYKAEEAGRKLMKVDPRGSSQTCPVCRERVPKVLSQRKHLCKDCGFETSRDHASALEILNRLETSLNALTPCSNATLHLNPQERPL